MIPGGLSRIVSSKNDRVDNLSASQIQACRLSRCTMLGELGSLLRFVVILRISIEPSVPASKIKQGRIIKELKKDASMFGVA